VLLAVRRTFITPFDRGDIKELITLMDDSIDQMQKTAKTIQLFEINAFEPHMRAMGDAIVEAAQLVPSSCRCCKRDASERQRASTPRRRR
jgi:uncharacterized protein Yka (UPF0111/DUF47 family)